MTPRCSCILALLLFVYSQGVYAYATSSSRGFCRLSTSIQAGDNKEPIEKRGPADNDLISNFFSKFLPTPEDIGLKRYDSVSRPENYPCVKNEFADLLPEDKDADTKLIRQLLAKTNLEYRPLKCVYNANKDGWKSKIFHSKVDKLGPALVLARAASGEVIGGYNPTGWVNYGEYRGSIAAFLFTFPDGDTEQRPVKLQKIAGAGMAQIDDGSGPKFGMEGFTVPLEGGNPKVARSKLALYYERMPDGRNTIFTGSTMAVDLKELKVFVGVYGKDERIPYSDALPFSLN